MIESTTAHLKQRAVADVLGISIDALNMSSALDSIANHLASNHKGYICVAGVHGVMEAQRSQHLSEVYEQSLITIPDGMPLVWVGHLQGHSTMQRVTGPDLMLQVFAEPRFAELTHFFYGGELGVAEELRLRLLGRFPQAIIVGTYTPPFRDLTASEEADLLRSISRLKPDVIWVGIGCPRQELFMARYMDRLETRLVFGVGAAFDYHTGRIRDCSPWVKHAGLQWLHRLIQNPRRLWKRYLRNNPAFIYRILLQLIGHKSIHNVSRAASSDSIPASSTSSNKATQC